MRDEYKYDCEICGQEWTVNPNENSCNCSGCVCNICYECYFDEKINIDKNGEQKYYDYRGSI